MRILFLSISLFSLLFAVETLNIDYALQSQPLKSSDAYAVKSLNNLYFFSYESQLRPNSFAPSQALESHTALKMQQHNLHSTKRSVYLLNFFDNTHGVKALAINDNLSLVAALAPNGSLKLAYVNDKGQEQSSFTQMNAQYKNIIRLYNAQDETFYLLLTVSNASNKASFFNRGIAKEDIILLQVDKNLRPLMQKHFGSINSEILVDGIMTDSNTFKIISQENATNITIYLVSLLNGSIQKNKFTLPQADHIRTIYKRKDDVLLLGGSHGKIYVLKDPIQSISLAAVEDGKINTITQNQSNQWLISGSCTNKQGDEDAFLILMDANLKLIWARKVMTTVNEYGLHHEQNGEKIDFFGKRSLENGEEKLFYLSVSKRGFTYKPQSPLDIAQKFSAVLRQRVGNKYERFLDILPSSDILLTHYFNPKSSSISSLVEKDLKSFFNDFINLLSDKTYVNHIDKIYFNGFSSSEWHNVKDSKRYLNNAKLSQDRAFAMLQTVIENIKSTKQRHWFEKHIILRAYSDSKTVKNHQQLENFEKSRRGTLSIHWK